jgi:uncharacterized Fe-S cluster-containing radical SAM superfamily enzyme
LDKEKANYICNKTYPLKKIKNLLKLINKKSNLILAPVYIPGINDKDVEDLIKFSIKLKCPIMIQNFLEYSFGKKPVKAISMKHFFTKIQSLEKKYSVNLTNLKHPEIKKDKPLEKPFKKGDIINVKILNKARLRNSKLGVAKNRTVTIINCLKNKGIIRTKIIRDKHNIYTALPV